MVPPPLRTGKITCPGGRAIGRAQQKWTWIPPKTSRVAPGWYELPSGSGSAKAMYRLPPRFRPGTRSSAGAPALWVRSLRWALMSVYPPTYGTLLGSTHAHVHSCAPAPTASAGVIRYSASRAAWCSGEFGSHVPRYVTPP